MDSVASAATTTTASTPKRLSVFERYLSLWVGLCMVVGVGLGLSAPGMMQGLRSLDRSATSDAGRAVCS
jgi:ACR3 family arsenite transporter